MKRPKIRHNTSMQHWHEHMQQPHPCILCGAAKAPMRGVFMPSDSAAWGAPPGKKRVFGHALCVTCYAKPDRDAAVEQHMLTTLRQTNAPWN